MIRVNKKCNQKTHAVVAIVKQTITLHTGDPMTSLDQKQKI